MDHSKVAWIPAPIGLKQYDDAEPSERTTTVEVLAALRNTVFITFFKNFCVGLQQVLAPGFPALTEAQMKGIKTSLQYFHRWGDSLYGRRATRFGSEVNKALKAYKQLFLKNKEKQVSLKIGGKNITDAEIAALQMGELSSYMPQEGCETCTIEETIPVLNKIWSTIDWASVYACPASHPINCVSAAASDEYSPHPHMKSHRIGEKVCYAQDCYTSLSAPC